MRWVIVDGIDGSGKSTIALMIKEYYEERGESVYLGIHPSDRWLGRIARRALQGSGRIMHIIVSVFFLMDVLRSLGLLRRIRGRYQMVIFVRYLMATAYMPGRLAKISYDFFSRLLPVPDRLLLVDTDPQVAMDRIAKREDAREMFEDLPRLTRIREKALSLAGSDWEILDNNASMELSRKQLERVLSAWDSRDNGNDPPP